MSQVRRTSKRRAALGSLILLGLVGGLLGIAAEGAIAGTDDPGNLSVNITESETSTPTPSGSPSTGDPGDGTGGSDSGGSGSGSGGSGAGGAGGGGSGSGGSGGGTSSTPIEEITPGGDVSVAGMLYLGGLNASGVPSFNPAEGTVNVWFTVRNASTSPIDATAKFWLDGPFNNQLDEVNNVAVGALQAGETRVVSAELRHGGQWTFLTAHVTLTPPDSVDGTALAPVTRDAGAFLFPWLIVLLIVLAIVGIVVYRVRRAAVPLPAAAVAA